jgi:hypothetical protein
LRPVLAKFRARRIARRNPEQQESGIRVIGIARDVTGDCRRGCFRPILRQPGVALHDSRKTVNPGWFSKGSSPNPGGRPTASPAPQPSAFQVLVEKTLTVTDRAGSREITIEETLQQQTYQRALNGDRMASREVLKWRRELDW